MSFAPGPLLLGIKSFPILTAGIFFSQPPEKGEDLCGKFILGKVTCSLTYVHFALTLGSIPEWC